MLDRNSQVLFQYKKICRPRREVGINRSLMRESQILKVVYSQYVRFFDGKSIDITVSLNEYD